MTKDQKEILEKIKADNSKQKALDYLIKSFPELNEDYILCEVANYEIDGFDYRNPVVHRYIAYTDAVKELQEEMKEQKEIIREYIRLSLQEDKDIEANVKLFQRAEAFIKGGKFYESLP